MDESDLPPPHRIFSDKACITAVSSLLSNTDVEIAMNAALVIERLIFGE